jgi:hypothetical protein
MWCGATAGRVGPPAHLLPPSGLSGAPRPRSLNADASGRKASVPPGTRRREQRARAGVDAGHGGDRLGPIRIGAKAGATLHRPTPAGPGGRVRNRSLTVRRTPSVEVGIFQIFFPKRNSTGAMTEIRASQTTLFTNFWWRSALPGWLHGDDNRV